MAATTTASGILPGTPLVELARWRILLFKGVERRQANVGDFLLSEVAVHNGVLRRWLLCV
jgi:hypothetical protein